MNNPSVSVISPVYNTADYLGACVDSCLSQTLDSIEVVLVDDGSSDGSAELVDKLATSDPRVVAVHQTNAGAAAARNNGLDHARGEFVFFIDSDDYIPQRTALERLYTAAVENDVQIAGGSMCLDRDGTVDFESMHGSALDSFAREEVVAYADYQYDYDFTRFVYSLPMLREHGIRFPLLTQYEDPLFHVDAMMAAGRFATIPDAVYAYRYGHQNHAWSSRAALDRLVGMTRLLELSSREGMAKLHRYVLDQLDTEVTWVMLDHTADHGVMAALFKANGAIDCALLRANDPSFPEAYVIEPLRILLDDYRRFRKLRESRPYRMLLKAKHLLEGHN